MNPILSVIVAIVSDTTASRADAGPLAACLQSLFSQTSAPPFEIIVPYHEGVDGIDDLRERFPLVKFLFVPDVKKSGSGREHHDVLRARGLAAAHGSLVGLIEDHALADSRWCAEVVAAHQQAYSAIGGAIENGVDSALNWAVYYCDFGRYQNPLPDGESQFASDANVTYKRSALEQIRESWEHSFREVVVNGALRRRGEKVRLSAGVIVYQNRTGLRLGPALHERFIWGRSYAATRSLQLSASKRLFYFSLSGLLPGILLLRMGETAWQRRRHFGSFARALPLTAMLVTVWSFGEAVGYVAGVRARRTDLDS